ncbi:MAG: hypothetical protein ACREJV_08690, partial [Candidatus Rokuibacteriota bacterium]
MLSEEALVLIGAAVALGLLILGVLELIAPSRSRYPRRRGAPNRDPWRRARTSSAPPRPRAIDPVRETTGRRPIFSDRSGSFTEAMPGAPSPQPAPAAPSPVDVVRSWGLPVADAASVAAEPAATQEPEATPPALPPPQEVTPAEPEVVEASAGRDEADAPESPLSSVERCYALYEAQQFREVVTEATGVLDAGAGAPDEDTARLWGVVGLARQALGEPAAARVAFEAAIAAAPPGERATWERHLAVLALRAGRERSAWAQSPSLADG